MEVAPVDLGTAPWGCVGSSISGADGTSVGTGYQNTIDILHGCAESGTCAELCNNYVLNSYSDWFMPSESEWLQVYNNLHLITAVGLQLSENYWVSSEVSSNWSYFYTGNYLQYGGKDFPMLVRPVRWF